MFNENIDLIKIGGVIILTIMVWVLVGIFG